MFVINGKGNELLNNEDIKLSNHGKKPMMNGLISTKNDQIDFNVF